MRIKLQELTITRLWEALVRRIMAAPDIASWNLTQRGRANRARLKALHNIAQGKRGFILANGPSLAKMDLSPLKNELTIGMNRIYLHFDKMPFTPTYYACINELILEQFSADIQSLPMPKFLNWNRRQLYPNDDTILFLRSKLALNESFSTNITRYTYSGGTVTHGALQIAYHLGLSEVIIIGLDHSFVEKGVPSKTEVRKQEKDESHFHPNYFPKGIKWQLPDLPRSEIAYAHARRAFEEDGRRIIDATNGGKCFVFEKQPFEEVINLGVNDQSDG
ncbi:6-hydroxymethylpterin diphosphokinase MptE-like protein [Candidatus Neomarinimicrobiota bacterium]